MRRLGYTEVEPHVGPAVVIKGRRGFHPLDGSVEEVEVPRRRSLGRQHGGPSLDCHALVEQSLQPISEPIGPMARREGRRFDHEGTAAPTPESHHVPILDQLRQRIVEGGSIDAELSGQFPL